MHEKHYFAFDAAAKQLRTMHLCQMAEAMKDHVLEINKYLMNNAAFSQWLSINVQVYR